MWSLALLEPKILIFLSIQDGIVEDLDIFQNLLSVYLQYLIFQIHREVSKYFLEK